MFEQEPNLELLTGRAKTVKPEQAAEDATELVEAAADNCGGYPYLNALNIEIPCELYSTATALWILAAQYVENKVEVQPGSRLERAMNAVRAFNARQLEVSKALGGMQTASPILRAVN